MLNVSEMNKGQLRAAMREAGLPSGGLNVEGMRAALLNLPVAELPPEEPAQMLAEIPYVLADDLPAIDLPAIGLVAVELPVVEPVALPVIVPAVIAAPVRPARLEANGVKQPSIGTICRQIWDYCDATKPSAKDLRARGAGRLDDVTMTVQFYRWRKFHGIRGRQA